MKTKILLVPLLALLMVMQAAGQVVPVVNNTTVSFSLQDCLKMALQNTDVQNASLEREKTKYQVKEAQSKLYPQVQGYSNFNYYFAIPKMVIPGEVFGQTGPIPVEIGTKFDWSNGFSASQVLYNQSYLTSIKLAQRMAELQNLSLQQQKEEIVYQVSQVYYLCVTTHNQMIQLGANLKNADRLTEILRLQNENGIVRKVDLGRVTANKNNLQTQIDNLEQLYQEQLNLLKYLTGLEVAEDINLADTLSYSSVETSYEAPDINNKVDFQILTQQIEINTLTRKMSRESFLPSLSATGQYYFQGQRNEFDFFEGKDKFFKVGMVGLSLSVPIFNGFEKRAKTAQYDITIRQLENTRQSSARFFSKEFNDAIRQYENSRNALARQEGNIKIAENTYDISLQGYREQVTSLSDVLLAENDLTEARLSYYNALLQLKNAELTIKKLQGDLLTDL